MSRFKSYLNQQESASDKHFTPIHNESDEDEDPPVPPTRHPMVNRLTSSIDESLVNLSLLSQTAQIERERNLYQLEQLFLEFRNLIDKLYQRYEREIKSSYKDYDQHLLELSLKLKKVREELIENFTSLKNNEHHHHLDDQLFDVNKYRSLELLTSQTLNQTMRDKKSSPKYRIQLKNLEELEQIFSIEIEPKRIPIEEDFERELTPIQRCSSIETSTSTNVTDEYDNVPKEDFGQYHVSYHNSLKRLERWSSLIHSGNYFIPLLTSYRQSSILLYCLERQSFICYDSQSLLSLPRTIQWRGTRPSAVYWFDEMNMLFIACQSNIFGCFVDEDIPENQRIHIRIPIEQTSTWSDTQGELCWPKFLSCGNGTDRLLYAYWTDLLSPHASTTTSFIYYQIQGSQFRIQSRYLIDGRLRALHSSLSTYRIGLLIEQISSQCTYLEIRTLKEFSLLSKIELRTLYEQFRYGSCLTTLFTNSNSYIFCDHKQNQLWYVNGDTGEMKVKQLKEAIYSVCYLLDGTLALIIGTPMRFDFLYDSNETGIILKELFYDDQESFEV